MKEENLNILSFSENDQKVSAPVDDSEPSLIVAFRKIFDLISVNCEELDSIEKVLFGHGKELDNIREKDIVNAVNFKVKVIDTSKDINSIHKQIDDLVDFVNTLKKKGFKKWDYENEFNIGLAWDYKIESNDIIISIENMQEVSYE